MSATFFHRISDFFKSISRRKPNTSPFRLKHIGTENSRYYLLKDLRDCDVKKRERLLEYFRSDLLKDLRDSATRRQHILKHFGNQP